MKKILLIVSLCLLVSGCSAKPDANEENLIDESIEDVYKELPVKENPDSTPPVDSPITVTNIDDYLFREDTFYVDTRDASQIVEEGFIAGFTNIPFYEVLVSLKEKDQVLFTMKKMTDENGKVTVLLGNIGSFVPNYEESEQIIKEIFPKDKNIIFFSTAGVEATYLMNLLIQLGYDSSKLYNAGHFSNSMGKNVAYREYEDAKYYVEGTQSYKVTYSVDWGELTKIEK